MKNDKTNSNKEFNFIFPGKDVNIAGIDFHIVPFSVGETKMIAEKLGSALESFFSLGDQPITSEILSEIYSKSYEGVAYVVTYVLNKSGEIEVPIELFDQFDVKSALHAITEIVEVNRDFFFESVDETASRLANLLNPEEPEKLTKS